MHGSKVCTIVLLATLCAWCPALAVGLFEPDGLSDEQFGGAMTELGNRVDVPGSWLGIAIGSPFYNGAGTDNGRVSIWIGRRELTLSADLEIVGTYSETFGSALARIGDVNGDHYDDLAVGAPTYHLSGFDDGRVYVYFGGPILDATADVILEGGQAATGYTGGRFGFSVSAAGDFNGDGIADLIVGAPLANAPGDDQGAAFVYFGQGNSSGLSLVPDVTLTGEVQGDQFGWSVADAGNFYGGNLACVVVGAPGHDGFASLGGAAYVYKGSLPPLNPDAVFDLKLGSGATSKAGGRFGFAVRGIGRWSSDSTDDIAVGAPYYNQELAHVPGRIEIFFGGTNPSSLYSRYVEGELADDYFGYALGDVGDVAGTASTDLLIGAPGRDAPATSAGRAYLYLGGDSSHPSASALTILPAAGINADTEADDLFGSAVSAAGDFDGDGELDYLVGAPMGNIRNNTEAGYARLYDSSGTVTPVFLKNWTGAWIGVGTVRLEFTFNEPPEWLSRLRIVRRIFSTQAGHTVLRAETVVLDGPLAPGTPRLSREGETWIFTDEPGIVLEPDELGYRLDATTSDGATVELGELAVPRDQAAAGGAELQPAHPNPFNPLTTLTFRAPAGTPTVCRLLDLRGLCLRTLFAGRASGDWQQVQWDGRMGDGQPAAAGLYLVRLEAAGRCQTERVILAK